MKQIFFVVLFNLTLILAISFSAPVNAATDACPDTHRDLYFSTPMMTGNDVLELQERLIELGFNPGQADGFFGVETEKAVKELQTGKKMPATGVMTLEMWEKLGSGESATTATGDEITQPEGQISIVINTDKRTLTVYDNDQVLVVFPVAVGKYKTPTPVGEWKVIEKSARKGGALGTRWMRLNIPWGTYGIHGTNKPYSIGSYASAGCIRMHNSNVEKLFPLIPNGTPVKITSEKYPKYPPGFKKRNLKKEIVGPDVVEMQTKLLDTGLLWGRADGRFGTSTELFVKRYQAFTGQEITGEFTQADYDFLAELAAILVGENRESPPGNQ